MLTQLHDFTSNLKNLSYLNYKLYSKEEILFITLYNTEDLQKYVIMDHVITDEHPQLIACLERHKQR
ncbi:MAG: hypothetical protein V4714_01730 [Bacteroidota bacterium]